MNCLIILAGLVTMAYATGLGGPETVDFASVPISKDIIAKAKELGKTTNVVVKQYTVNYATRYNLHEVELEVNGKTCTIRVSEEKPLKWLKGKNNCILCC